jgi:hypothetical protein
MQTPFSFLEKFMRRVPHTLQSRSFAHSSIRPRKKKRLLNYIKKAELPQRQKLQLSDFRRVWRWLSSGMLRPALSKKSTDVSEVLTASIIRIQWSRYSRTRVNLKEPDTCRCFLHGTCYSLVRQAFGVDVSFVRPAQHLARNAAIQCYSVTRTWQFSPIYLCVSPGFSFQDTREMSCFKGLTPTGLNVFGVWKVRCMKCLPSFLNSKSYLCYLRLLNNIKHTLQWKYINTRRLL